MVPGIHIETHELLKDRWRARSTDPQITFLDHKSSFIKNSWVIPYDVAFKKLSIHSKTNYVK
jgi:hypothetical protein